MSYIEKMCCVNWRFRSFVQYINRRAQRHSKHKPQQKHKRSTKEVPPWNGQSWLSGRTQQVVLDGQASDPVPVLSCLPQGSVLGPILFLIFINDLPDNIRSSVCLFADDCDLYRSIYSIQDCFIWQEDLTRLGQWEADLQMKFNGAKCHSMRVYLYLYL